MCPIWAQQVKHLRGDPGQAIPGRLCPQCLVLLSGHAGRQAVISAAAVLFLKKSIHFESLYPSCADRPVLQSLHFQLSTTKTLVTLKDAQHIGTHISLTACSSGAAQTPSWGRHAAANCANPKPGQHGHPLALMISCPTLSHRTTSCQPHMPTGTCFCLVDKMIFLTSLLSSLRYLHTEGEI